MGVTFVASEAGQARRRQTGPALAPTRFLLTLPGDRRRWQSGLLRGRAMPTANQNHDCGGAQNTGGLVEELRQELRHEIANVKARFEADRLSCTAR